VLGRIHDTLIAWREGERLHGFMKSYGVLVAYLHDIGMIDFRSFGRAMHPELSSQALFDPAFDHVMYAIWQSDCGGITSRLRGLAHAGALAQDPRLVLRELLAMANCHSKSKVPVAILSSSLLSSHHRLRPLRVVILSFAAACGLPHCDGSHIAHSSSAGYGCAMYR
jgi:hypothetical protein